MTHSAWWAGCDALAVYRLAILITRDSITGRLRERLRVAVMPDLTETPVTIGSGHGQRRRAWRGWLYEWMTCPWCVSAWAAAAVTAVTVEIPHVWQFPAFALALSAAAGFLSERT